MRMYVRVAYSDSRRARSDGFLSRALCVLGRVRGKRVRYLAS
jgi:hypothetical protein